MHNTLLAPFSACLVLGLALGDRFLCRILSTGWLVFLGAASYAMYILHLPLWAWLAYIAHLHGNWHHGPAGMPIYLLLVITLSSLAFKYLEQPAAAIFKSNWSNRRTRRIREGAPIRVPSEAMAAKAVEPST